MKNLNKEQMAKDLVSEGYVVHHSIVDKLHEYVDLDNDSQLMALANYNRVVIFGLYRTSFCSNSI